MSASPPSTPDDYYRLTVPLLLTVALVGVFAFIQVYSVQSILPELQRDLNASVVEIGNAVGMTVLAVALISPFIGMLSDALGRRWLITGSVFALAGPTALMMQVQSVHGLLVLRFLQGLAVPGVSVVVIAYVGEEFRGASMVRVMTGYVAGTVLGGFLGRFLMGHLAEFMAWRTAFGLMAVLNLVGAWLVWRGLPPSRHFTANARFADSLSTLGRVLRNPALQAACALGFTVLFALVGLFTFVNLHLAAEPYRFSSGDLANIFSVYLLGVVVTPMAGRFIPRIGSRRTVLAAVALAVELLRRDRLDRLAGRLAPHSGAVKPGWVVKIGEDYMPVSILEGMISIPMEIDMSVDGGKPLTVSSDWRPGEAVWRGRVGARQVAAQLRPLPNGLRIAWQGMAVEAYAMLPRIAELERLMPVKQAPDTSRLLLCPMPGLVVSIAVSEGQEVKAGETLAVVEAMKMENVLRAERDLTVAKLNARPGDSLAVDAVIMEFA